VLCDKTLEETTEHLLFHCEFSTSCWTELNLHWQQRGTRLQIIEKGKEQWKSLMFMEIFTVGAWCIWKERNIAPTLQSWKRRFKEIFPLLIHRSKEELHSFILDFSNNL
jgi:hypothetical protein